MDNIFGKNIVRLRKELSLTQEDLAHQTGVTYQAVSKWENGNSFPDISTLPLLAGALHTSIDSLLGYITEQKRINDYEQRYKTSDYYWGVKPSDMCYELLKMLPPERPLKLLDIGCGEGKNAVFFAKNGYQVSAFDITQSGIDKAKRLSEKHNVNINLFKADVLDFRLESEFDVIFCSGVLHYIPQNLRVEIFENYKKFTTTGGINALNVFIEKPFIINPDGKQNNGTKWISGELLGYYFDWKFNNCNEIIFDCDSGNIPHKHCMDILIAEKI